ncbi:MAG: phosphoglucosamine mutase [Acidimicrobiales bacterium]
MAVPRFGTDGIRGVANVELTPELVLALGRAAARVLGTDRFVVGRDPRASGPLLQAALSAGLAAEGAAVVDLGVLPTPGVAFGSARLGAHAAMVSASHNPFSDNGVKLFAAGGHKLDDATEAAVEAELQAVLIGSADRPGAPVGDITGDLGVAAAYADHLRCSLEGRRLEGLRVVLDCANGAASAVAPAVFAALGAEVTVIADRPDGTNINRDCGSTYPETLAAAVVAGGADAGLAFDGDADRVLAVDVTGALVDGDQMLGLLALDRLASGWLAGGTVVATVMANLGLRRSMAAAGIAVHETPVGDRHVLAALHAGGWSLGGEQSGHLIFPELATTGDGLLTGLQVLDVMARSGRSLGDLAAAAMTRLPQVLRNVVVAGRAAEVAAAVAPTVEAAQAELGDDGRVLVRASGTEPLVRVMVEAVTAQKADEVAARLVAAVERVAGW